MTVLEALAILEAAVLECKKRNVNTLEVKQALDFLESHI
jgi:hemerythrin-like domain-containing protein